MRDRLEVQSETVAKDRQGQEKKTAATYLTIWAELRAVSGREYLNAAQSKAEVSHRVRTRWFPGLLPSHRFKLGSRLFNVVWVDDTDNRHRELVVLVKEQIQP